MKLTLKINDFSDNSLRYAQQLGATHLSILATSLMDDKDFKGPIKLSLLREVKKIARKYNLKIGVILLPQEENSQHWNIRLGNHKREKEIHDVCETIELLGLEEIPVAEYVFNLTAVYGSQVRPLGRGGANVRSFDYEKIKLLPPDPRFEATEEDVWERITFFLENVIPIAERVGVKLACHPDDPPVPQIKGETRVLGNLEGLKRLIDIVPSKANGLSFCQGTIAEMGVNVIEAIKYFGYKQKIHHVHFRNVRGIVPKFNETFIDDGDVDMVKAFKTYVEVDYKGTIMPDHVPALIGEENEIDNRRKTIGRAHATGYIKALIDAFSPID